MIKITNTENFNKKIRDFAKMIEVDSNTVVRKLVFELYAGMIEKTPVDVGYARGSWNLSANEPNLSVPEPPSENAPKDSYPRSKIKKNIPSATRYTTLYYVTNNLPYIQALEAGHSKQMDKGHMVSRTVNDVLANFEKLTKDLFK
jgi:hypothetical protein